MFIVFALYKNCLIIIIIIIIIILGDIRIYFLNVASGSGSGSVLVS